MQINKPLEFKGATEAKITVEFPAEVEALDNLTLNLKADMTPEIAEELGIPWIYAAGSIPHDGFKNISLTTELQDTQVRLVSSTGDGVVDTIYPEQVSKLKITSADDVKLTVSLEIGYTGRYEIILDFLRSNRTEPFDFIISSRQGSLFEGGTRVDMSDGEKSEAEEQPEEPAKRGRRSRKETALVN